MGAGVSYHTSILSPSCSHCGRSDDQIEVGNMTSNVGVMYRLVLPGPYDGGGRYDGSGAADPRGGLPGLSGLPVAVALPLLRQAILDMEARCDELLPLEPVNKWGSFVGAVNYLREIVEACERVPSGIVAVNW